MAMKFYISQHCQDRWIERVNGGLNKDSHTLMTIVKTINTSKDITSKIFDDVPRYILYLYEKYKSCGITIMSKDNIIFIAKKRKGTEKLYDVLTCYMDNNHLDQFKNTSLKRSEIFIRITEVKKKYK
jgi:hypothetical protein